jgi:hypothetical protein
MCELYVCVSCVECITHADMLYEFSTRTFKACVSLGCITAFGRLAQTLAVTGHITADCCEHLISVQDLTSSQDSGLLRCDGEWFPTVWEIVVPLLSFSGGLKALQSFEMVGATWPVTQHHVSLDLNPESCISLHIVNIVPALQQDWLHDSAVQVLGWDWLYFTESLCLIYSAVLKCTVTPVCLLCHHHHHYHHHHHHRHRTYDNASYATIML